MNRFIEIAPPHCIFKIGEAEELVHDIRANSCSQIEGYDSEKGCEAILNLDKNGVKCRWKGFYTNRDKGLQTINYSNITSIIFKKGLVFGTVEIRFSGGKIKIDNVNKELGNLFVSNVKRRMINANKNTSANNINPIDEVKKAKDLLDAGAISQEQFEQIRDKYLKMI